MRPGALLLLAALVAAGCGDEGEEQPADKPTCTAALTTKAVKADGLSALLATAADQGSKDVLKGMVADECCQVCPTSAATARPLVADMEACVTCAGGYSGGNPATHISNCTTQVCPLAP